MIPHHILDHVRLQCHYCLGIFALPNGKYSVPVACPDLKQGFTEIGTHKWELFLLSDST